MKFLEFVLANWGTAHVLIEPNTKQLGQMAKAMKAMMKIPGVRVWDKGTVSFN